MPRVQGCKSDCPVKVDMATYKAEFLAHFYKKRLRPIDSYTMGLVHWWARLGAYMPRLVNLITQNRFVSEVVKAIGGIARERGRTSPNVIFHARFLPHS